MPTIYDLVTSKEIASYYNEQAENRQPFLGEMYFPNAKKLGMDLSWIKGSKGLPVALKASALDSKVLVRDRIGFEKLSTEMPFFKESMNIDEKQRQELNKVMASGNQAMIDMVLNRIFADEVTLLDGASVTRERMRMQLLTTGKILISENGVAKEYDYGIETSQKETLIGTAKWDAPTTSTPLDDIARWQDAVETATGQRPTEAICNTVTFNKIVASTSVKNLFKDYKLGVPSRNSVLEYIERELGLTIFLNNKQYATTVGGAGTKYVADGLFVLVPPMELGNTWFGTTPEESDLMSSNVANVEIVDTGVAITTSKLVDPVNVSTKVSMIALPDFPQADKIFIATTF